jgi:hypothetical protein
MIECEPLIGVEFRSAVQMSWGVKPLAIIVERLMVCESDWACDRTSMTYEVAEVAQQSLHQAIDCVCYEVTAPGCLTQLWLWLLQMLR